MNVRKAEEPSHMVMNCTHTNGPTTVKSRRSAWGEQPRCGKGDTFSEKTDGVKVKGWKNMRLTATNCQDAVISILKARSADYKKNKYCRC